MCVLSIVSSQHVSLYECDDNINIMVYRFVCGALFYNIHYNTEYCLGVHFTVHNLHYCSNYLKHSTG